MISSHMSSLFALGAMPSCLTELLLIFLISLTIRTGKTHRESQLFTVICLFFLAHHILIIFADLLDSSLLILYLLRVVHSCMVFLLPVSIHYIHSTLNLPHTKKAVAWLYLTAMVLFAFVYTDHYVYLDQDLPVAGPVYSAFIIIALTVFVVYAVIVFINFFRSRGQDALKSLFIIIGLGPTYLLTFWDVLPLFGVPSIFLGGFVFIPMGIYTYGILRYNILDNTGWFSMGHIPNFLTVLVWLPLAVAVMLYAVTQNTLFYPDITARLFPRAIPAMTSVLVCFGLATFCFQEGPRKVQTMVFGGMCALWGLMNLDIILVMLIQHEDVALRISRFDHFFLVMQLGFCGHLFYFFAGFRKWIVYMVYGISLVFAPMTQTNLYLKGMHTFSWGFFGIRGILFDTLIGISAVNIILGSYFLLRKIKATAPGSETRRQYVFFLLGIQLMGLFGITNIPAMSGVDLFPGASFMFVPVLLMSYGVFKYDLIKVNAYTRRRIWNKTAVILTSGGYILLGALAYTTLSSLAAKQVFEQVVDSGIPVMITLAVSVFFSVLSLRVGPTQTGSRLFGLICLLFAVMATDILLGSVVSQPETALRTSRLCHFPLAMGMGLYAHLMVLVCRKERAMPVVVFFYVAGTCLSLLSQSPSYLSGVIHYPWGFFPQGGPVFYVFCLLGGLVFIFNGYVFHSSLGTFTDPRDRQQLMLFSIGLAFSALFAAGHIPAMAGLNVRPLGNYVFFPLSLFGYAMFRKNLKDVLLLLNRSLYVLGVGGFLWGIAYGLYQAGVSLWTWGAMFGVFIAVWILFKGFDRVWIAIMGLFFGRQKEILDQLYTRMPDQLSKSRSLKDLLHLTSDPFFQVLFVKTFRILFYSEKDKGYKLYERLNPTVEDNATKLPEPRTISARHPLLALVNTSRSAVTQAQVEAWIADTDTALDADDVIRSADIIQPVYFENTLISLLLLNEKVDGSVYSKNEKEFISRIGLILGPYIANAKLLQGLEAQIETRTHDLTAALQVKSDFLARMSHEVRSPLNAILGMGELMTETPLSREQSQYMDILVNSSGLLLSVISDILDFSKIDSGGMTLETISFDLFRLMKDLKDIVAASTLKKGLSVTLNLDKGIRRYVLGDPHKLAQVVLNLADNAVRFTDDGNITIHVDKDTSGHIRFSVEDTGVGIPEDKQAMIFDRFSQAESSTTRRYGGSGLGLTISKKLVELMGGTLSVTSQVGEGSRFVFTASLPEADPVDMEEPFPLNTSRLRLKSFYDEVQTKEAEAAVSPHRSLSLLLAEDMRTNVQVIRLYLKNKPISLDVAKDGSQAVRMFQLKDYDLVLMDIHMPHMDGYDAVRHIRAWERDNNAPRTPVIALTAHRPDPSRQALLDEFDAFLMKPISKKDLIQAIGQAAPFPAPPEPPPANPLDTIDQELMAIIPELIDEIHEELQTIVFSLNSGDFDTACRLSHGFKGAAGNCGLFELSDMFKTLYDLSLYRVHDKARDMISTIRHYVNDLNRSF